MNVIDWAEGVNKVVRRDGSSWSEQCGFIEDETKSGKTKRRMAHSMAKRQFTVKFLFKYSEYLAFSRWYNTDTRRGLIPFYFPAVDRTRDSGVIKAYRFASGTAPEYSNKGGEMVECNMKWEEYN